MAKNSKIALTICGVDSGGACGLHADIRTFTRLGVYGISAITALTSQNSERITAVVWSTPGFLRSQLDMILSDYGAQSAKTGFIGNRELVSVIAQAVKEYQLKNFIIDPVLVNDEGKPLFNNDLIVAYRKELLPLAVCVTPNVFEAELLSGIKIKTRADAHLAAKKICDFGVKAVLIKRIIHKNKVSDLFFSENRLKEFTSPLIQTRNIHGSGDTLSAAITAHLAQGETLASAVSAARNFTRKALLVAKDWTITKSYGPVSHL